jgi:hypothetical protein
MTSIIFRTPGTLDMRAFTTMGMSAKPSTERPIGVFGTGLKYAVAVLVRLGASLEVHTGGHRYWFETADVDFRGATFKQIVMRRDTWALPLSAGWKKGRPLGNGWVLGRRQKLPFTTQYGLNWQMWMAFRELYANTLDEGGDTLELTDEQWALKETAPNRWANTEGGTETIIAVSHDDFTQAYRDRADTFLDLGDRPTLSALPGLEVRVGSTQRMFYQGLRALDLGKPALYTYNVTAPQHLTEDRQLGREWAVRSLVADTIAKCDDMELIKSVVTAKEGTWEHGLTPNTWVTPSDAFHRVMAGRPRGVSSGWGGWYPSFDPRPEAKRDPWHDSPRPWRVDGGDVVDTNGVALLSKPFTLHEGHWATLADRIIRMANHSVQADAALFEEAPRAMLSGDIGWADATLLYDPIATALALRNDDGDDVPF